MTDYRELSEEEKIEVHKKLIAHFDWQVKNDDDSFDPDGLTHDIESGYYCAMCWVPYYNCLCSHED